MLNFREITLEDRPWIQALLRESDYMGCEYSFANNMAWRRWHNTEICRFADFYICRAQEESGFSYTFPAGKGDYHTVLDALREDANAQNQPLILTGVTEPDLWRVLAWYPDQFELEEDPDASDYIYLAEDLITLGGRKYHQKRNHVKRFSEYGAVYSPMTPADFDDCVTFSAQSYNLKNGVEDSSSRIEQFAIHTFFTHFEAMELCGGVLRVNGEVVAMTIGEVMNSNTLCVHIEKANTAYQGAYAAINQAFCAAEARHVKYVNREEDMGLEGLRKSKRSYHPVFQLQKYTMTQKK